MHGFALTLAPLIGIFRPEFNVVIARLFPLINRESLAVVLDATLDWNIANIRRESNLALIREMIFEPWLILKEEYNRTKFRTDPFTLAIVFINILRGNVKIVELTCNCFNVWILKQAPFLEFE